MNRASPRAAAVVVAFVLALAGAAFAQEYTAETADGLFVDPPKLVAADNPDGATAIVQPDKNAVAPVQVTLPFSFQYFGRVYGTVSVSEDGWLAFGTQTTVASDNPALSAADSTAAPNAVVAPLWDDLRTGRGAAQSRGFPQNSVVWFTDGTSPNRRFVVAWLDMDTQNRASAADLSFEVLLHEDTGVVEFAYDTQSTGWSRLSYTAGIEDETGARAFGGPNLANDNAAQPAHDQRFVPLAVTVTGVVTREVPATGATDDPVVGAQVALYREGDATNALDTALTDATGNFAVTSLGIDRAPTLHVVLLASGEEVRVTDASGKTLQQRLDAAVVVPVGAPSLGTVSLRTLPAGAAFLKALNVQQAARRGFAAVRTVVPSVKAKIAAGRFPQIEARISSAAGATSNYTPAVSSSSPQITIAEADANFDDVVLREFGQHVLASIAVHPGKLAAHQWATPAGDTAAFADGFSFWFAGSVQHRAQFVGPTPATQFDLGVPTPAATGPFAAGAIAASLWDLVDGVTEPYDSFAGTLDGAAPGELPSTALDVITTLDQKWSATTGAFASGSASWTVASFLDRWRARGAVADPPSAVRAFVHRGTLVDDALEPNDRAGEEKALPQDAGTLAVSPQSLTLNAANEDRFSFALGAAPLTVTVVAPEPTEFEVSILDPRLADADANPVVGPVRATLQAAVTTPLGLAPERYVARVVWVSGSAAHATLTVAAPLALVTDHLAPATVLQPYNHDVEVAGGLAPLTVVLEPAVRGLVVADTPLSTVKHLTGLPEVVGAHDLTVFVTDGGGARRQVGTLRLSVNPRLALLPVFGIAAGRQIPVGGAALGTGGSDPQWTVAGPATVPAGISVAAGATLQIQGTPADAGAFEVRATATDGDFAPLPEAGCDVVVCASLAQAATATVDGDAKFGFWFDAIERSVVAIGVSYRGVGAPPRLVALLDSAGVAMPTQGLVTARGPATRIAGFVAPRTGRWFVILAGREGAGGKGDSKGVVSAARARVRPPRSVHGAIDVAAPPQEREVEFEAVAGAHASIVVRPGLVGRPGVPARAVLSLLDAAGNVVREVASATGEGVVEVARAELAVQGRYRLHVDGADGSTGPVLYEIRVRTPPGGRFELP
jgi:hypothetical protein